MRLLPHPRPVLVDSTRVWVPPRRGTRRETIGMRANSFEASPTTEWLPALQYSWVLLRVTTVVWYAEVAVTLQTRNLRREATFRQWVPWDAIRLPTARESERWR